LRATLAEAIGRGNGHVGAGREGSGRAGEERRYPQLSRRRAPISAALKRGTIIMFKPIILAAAAALALSAGVAAPALAQPSGDEAAIRALEAQFAAAFSAKDVDAIMKFYAPDVFVYDVVPPREYVGAAAYRKDWEGLMSGFKGPLKFEISDLAVETAGPVAWSHSIQHVSGTDPAGKPSDMTVRVTDVYRKTADGWRIVQEHVSVPVDLATGQPDLQSKP
jgi:uncharacterized protein (TIGR02246 family)